MDNRTTKKFIKNNFTNVISLPYCAMQSLFNNTERNFYTADTLGWASDVFIINNTTAVVTGYRPFGNVHPSYDMMKFYENAAREIRKEYGNGICGYEELLTRLRGLAWDFVGEALHEKANGKGRK